MFFLKKQIDIGLTCPLCKSYFEDPRLLPCSHTFCQECIQDSIRDTSQTLVCPQCGKKHEVPRDGFPLNGVALYLTDSKADYVHHPQRSKHLANKIELLKESAERLKSRVSNGAIVIRERCAKLKIQMDLQAETRIEQIHQLKDELKSQVDKYENECVEAYENVPTSEIEQASKLVEEILSFCAQSEQCLNQFSLDSRKVNALIEESEKYSDSLIDTELKQIMKNKLLEFKKSEAEFDRDIIGKIAIKEQKFGHDKFIEHDIYKLKYQHFICVSNSMSCYPGFYAVCVSNDEELELVHFGVKGEVVKHQIIFKRSYRESTDDSISMTCVDGNLFLKFSFDSMGKSAEICGKKFEAKSKKNLYIVKLDLNFSPWKVEQFDQVLDQIVANSTKLFASSENKSIKIINHELELVSEINDLSKFCDMTANEEHLFLLEKDEKTCVLVIDAKKNSIMRQIDLSCGYSRLQAFGSDYLALFNTSLNYLHVYRQDERFTFVKEVHLDSSLQLTMTNDSSNVVGLYSKSYLHLFKFVEFHKNILYLVNQ